MIVVATLSGVLQWPDELLYGIIAGIGFIWMATLGLFEIYAQRMIGIPVMVVAILGIFGGYLFPNHDHQLSWWS